MGKLPKRKNIRLNNYDYSQAGYYFITICTKDRLGLFGEIMPGEDLVSQPIMQANEMGNMIHECWNKTNEIYDNVKTDAFCLMPNHIHGIIVISEIEGDNLPSLSKIIQGFKSVTTRMSFKYDYKTIWQRNYYEHIIRSEEEYKEIYNYILTNPSKWADDKYYIK